MLAAWKRDLVPSLPHADLSRASTVCGGMLSRRAISFEAMPACTNRRQSISPWLSVAIFPLLPLYGLESLLIFDSHHHASQKLVSICSPPGSEERRRGKE